MFVDWLAGENSAVVAVEGHNGIKIEHTLYTTEPLVFTEGYYAFDELGELLLLDSTDNRCEAYLLLKMYHRIPAIGSVKSITVTHSQKVVK